MVICGNCFSWMKVQFSKVKRAKKDLSMTEKRMWWTPVISRSQRGLLMNALALEFHMEQRKRSSRTVQL